MYIDALHTPAATPFTPSVTKQSTRTTWPTSSQLFRQAAGISPVGNPIKENCTCCMCGAHLSIETDPLPLALPADKNLFGDSFNNKLDIKVRGDVVCGDCLAVWHKEFLQSKSKSYAVENDGVYRLASSLNISAFILHPPKAPYVAIFNTRQQGHLIWRTPVQLPNSDTLVVRLDDELITVNRANVLAAVAGWQHIMARMKALKLKTKAPALLSYDLSQTATGLIFPTVKEAMEKDGEASYRALQSLQKLTIADWWALCAMREIDLQDPKTWPQPEKLVIDVSKNSNPSDADDEDSAE